MNGRNNKWTRRELLSVWTKFSRNLTGYITKVKLHQDYDEWKSCFSRVTGFPSRFSGGAFLSKKGDHFTIHLYVPKGMALEDRFEAFLHELAHIYLDHLGEREGNAAACDMEADGWVFANFSEEVVTLRRLLHWHRYGEDDESERERPAVTAEQREQIRSEMGEDFVLNIDAKSDLHNWIQSCKDELREFIGV